MPELDRAKQLQVNDNIVASILWNIVVGGKISMDWKTSKYLYLKPVFIQVINGDWEQLSLIQRIDISEQQHVDQDV